MYTTWTRQLPFQSLSHLSGAPLLVILCKRLDVNCDQRVLNQLPRLAADQETTTTIQPGIDKMYPCRPTGRAFLPAGTR